MALGHGLLLTGCGLSCLFSLITCLRDGTSRHICPC
ncbi:uncharacterized protein DEA37_0012692 [Paragonimus westermani]|uniref:Uncharacterized protein n=1 Tax=Paragonimus westermani TaxID=34504 RepID=A0A5J4NEB0_9TREM|nr:uncharacterized protein DEA37_0012692 [Paragonimus westermani]